MDDTGRRLIALEAKVEMLTTMMLGQAGSQQTHHHPTPAIEKLRGLTPKQNAACQLVWLGYSTEAMATMMGATVPTLKVHIKGAMRNLEVKTRAQIAVLMDEVINTTGEDVYRRVTGLPKDWGERPEGYYEITKMIRTKTR